MKKRYAYYVVFGNKGFVGHVSKYDTATAIIDEQDGGFCKGAMNLDEVEKYKAIYSKNAATQKSLKDEYRCLINDYMNGRGVKRVIEKRLV